MNEVEGTKRNREEDCVQSKEQHQFLQLCQQWRIPAWLQQVPAALQRTLTPKGGRHRGEKTPEQGSCPHRAERGGLAVG